MELGAVDRLDMPHGSTPEHQHEGVENPRYIGDVRADNTGLLGNHIVLISHGRHHERVITDSSRASMQLTTGDDVLAS